MAAKPKYWRVEKSLVCSESKALFKQWISINWNGCYCQQFQSCCMVDVPNNNNLLKSIYNPRCQKYPRHFVRILRWSGATQTKTCFVTFVTKLKIEDHMFPFFPFVSSPWWNCPKIEGHHSIEMLHLNLSKMLLNIKWAEFKYPYFCNIFWNHNIKYSCPM